MNQKQNAIIDFGSLSLYVHGILISLNLSSYFLDLGFLKNGESMSILT